MPQCSPTNPLFTHASEQMVWDALVAQLPDHATLIGHWRRTDADGEHEADIIVIWPGQGIFVIEVKGGRIDLRTDGSWTSTDHDGNVFDIDPITQVQRNAHVIRMYLEEHWSQGHLRVPWLAAFPQTTLPAGFETAKVARERIVDADDLPAIADRLVEIGRQGYRSHATAERCRAAVAVLCDQRDAQQALYDEQDERQRIVQRLTDEQFETLEQMADNPRFAIVGPAGSGKTYLALEQARRCAERGDRVAVLCYSVGLARFLQSIVDGWQGPKPAFVGTFHKLGHDWGVCAEPDAAPDWWITEAPLLMRDAALALPLEQRFDTIIIDEGQDFATSWWEAVQAALRELQGGGLFVFGDMEQDVFHRGAIKTLALPTSRLTRNMRNARPIAALAALLTSQSSRSIGVDGPPVRFEPCTREQAVHVAEDIAEGHLFEPWDADDVVLITMHHKSGQHNAMLEAYGKNGYWDEFWKNDDMFHGTVTGFKGLERPVVVLAVDGWVDDARAREALYAGITRARDLLVICGDIEDLRFAGGDAFVDALLSQQE